MGDGKGTIDGVVLNDPEMMESFITEAKEHLDTLEEDFLHLERQKDHPDRGRMDKVFRAIHSVKGAAGFLGLGKMTALAHVMETLLSRMRSGEIRPESNCIDALLAGVDLLGAMLDDLEHSEEVDVSAVQARLSGLLEGHEAGEVEETTGGVWRPGNGDAAEDDSGEDTGPFAEYEAETALLDRTSIDFGSSIRIPVDIVDKLMVLAGELVLVRNQHMLSVGESDPASRSISQRLDLVTSELQETIIRTRMQPMGKIFGKFPRIVRDLGNKLGKEIQISISGSEAELDKTILESLTDPMTHIVRNCCSHGIETPEERMQAGKDKVGRITLAAYHEAGRVNIDISDDGRGIDPQLIRRKALDRRLKTEAELEQMSDRELVQLIFLPGFSTVDQVSDVFGRGVGMDVVKTGIEKLGGSADIESTMGKGTTIRLRLPLTLAILPCLIVTVEQQMFAIPQSSLVELVRLCHDDKSKIESADDQEVYRLRDSLLPVVRLWEVLSRPMPFGRETRAEITERYRRQEHRSRSLNLAVLKAGSGRFGLVIDEILGTEEIVVKPMHSTLKSLGIYSGATIMGNGKAALILDAEGIAGHSGVVLDGRVDRAEEVMERAARDSDLQSVLLFRSGERERLAISLPLIRRIEPITLSDIERIGEREYITVDGTSTLVIRLDHVLKVSPVVERDRMFLILPRHTRRPVGFLASSLIDIEQTLVEVNVETYVQEGVLGTAIIREAMTLFLDIYRLVEIIEHRWFDDRTMGLLGSMADSKQVLLLEDVPLFRYLVKGYLEAEGFKVITAENGRVGLDCVGDTRFDLIVSDLDMPVMDGWEFLRRVRQETPQKKVPAIALTALDSPRDRQKAMECGFDRYEIKMDREHFLSSVAELLKLDQSQPPSGE